MPKGFTEKEKIFIREKLFQEGTRLFSQYGIQKTTVDEIAKAAGISKGSFYSFYPSKEALFFDILESLDKESKVKFSNFTFPADQTKKANFYFFLTEIFNILEHTSLFKKINPAEMDLLIRKLPNETIKKHLDHDNQYFEEFYTNWKNKGIFKEIDPKGFTGILKLLFYFNIHKEDYTADEFDATKNLLLEMVCDFIITE